MPAPESRIPLPMGIGLVLLSGLFRRKLRPAARAARSGPCDIPVILTAIESARSMEHTDRSTEINGYPEFMIEVPASSWHSTITINRNI